MAGCFGNSFIDRHMEQQLYDYLDSEYECEECGYISDIEDFDYDEKTEDYICPECCKRAEL